MKLRVGDWVEVLPIDDIVGTLDGHGALEGMPFMPEMAAFCGQRFRISAVAHKTCDTVNQTGGRAVRDAVHLDDLRCDGHAHGGCQAVCLLFWKTAWLKPAPGPGPHRPDATPKPNGTSVERLQQHTNVDRQASKPADDEPTYRCQATTLPDWSSPLKWWDVSQYVRDVRSGNVRLGVAIRTLFLAALRRMVGLPYGTRVWVWLLETAHRRLMGQPAPFASGRIPNGNPTPDERLNLQPGERVRLKPHDEILDTINVAMKNRGLSFDPEMSVHCDKTFTVAARVERIINERTGKMMRFTNPCIRLQGAECTGIYSPRRHLCPRRITSYFREVWLERLPAGTVEQYEPGVD